MEQWTDPGLGACEGMSPERVRKVLFEAVRTAHPAFNQHPAWLFAGEVFRVGPKVGMNLCVHAGVDPECRVCTLRPEKTEASSAKA